MSTRPTHRTHLTRTNGPWPLPNRRGDAVQPTGRRADDHTGGRAGRHTAVAGLAGLAGLAVLVLAAGLTGCSGSSSSSSGGDKGATKPPPSATAPAGPSGTAALKVTGGDETPGAYTLAYAPGDDDEFDLPAGNVKLTWSDKAHHVLQLSMFQTKIATGKVEATTTMKFGTEDKGYVDSVHTKCEVTVTTLGADSIAGRYDCRGVLGFSFATTTQLDTSVDAQGTFTYARKGALPPAPSAPAPGAPGGPNSASLVVTGGDGPTGSYPLTHDPSANTIWEPSDGRYELTWSDSAHHVLHLTGYDTALKSGAKADFTVTLRVSGDGTGFVDSTDTHCTVTLTHADTKSVAGSFTCTAVPGYDFNASTEKPTKLDAHGSFSYAD